MHGREAYSLDGEEEERIMLAITRPSAKSCGRPRIFFLSLTFRDAYKESTVGRAMTRSKEGGTA
jgi:hypothetical protein